MFLVGLLACLEKQFCSLRCEVCNCYCPYLFQSMILSFPFIAFLLHVLLSASASSAPFPRDTSGCNWQSELGPFCLSLIYESRFESRTGDRFINRLFARSHARSFPRAEPRLKKYTISSVLRRRARRDPFCSFASE